MKRYSFTVHGIEEDGEISTWEPMACERKTGIWCKYDDYITDRAKDREEIERLEKALAFYANKETYLDHMIELLDGEPCDIIAEIWDDMGKIAHKALAEKEGT